LQCKRKEISAKAEGKKSPRKTILFFAYFGSQREPYIILRGWEFACGSILCLWARLGASHSEVRFEKKRLGFVVFFFFQLRFRSLRRK
jgi:hypothetical protein